jgi:Cu+-exporting ATPase
VKWIPPFVAYAKELEIELKNCGQFNSETGKGIVATVGRRKLLLGNKAWLLQHGVEVKGLLQASIEFSEQGKTPVFMAVSGKESAVFGIADNPRSEATSAIERLNKLGIQTLMVTGDTSKTAHYIAEKVGIKKVIAEASPEQKLQIINQLQEEGKQVGMIGDGINDAPALAAANVGFAIGTGTDIAIESADITLVQGDISNVTDAIELSTSTIRIIKQNLFWAFAYNTIAIPVATLGKLNPMIASGAMALSSVSVVVNSLRLYKK